MTKSQRIKLAVAVGAAAGLFVLGLFWCGGFDFDHRGEIGFYCLFCTVFVTVSIGGLTYTLSDRRMY